jgi:nucleotidyltransferase substrate binding protein (TIGR01987 family)
MEHDIRCKQRLQNFTQALQHLKRATNMKAPSNLEKEGAIQRFEFTHELAWKLVKDYLEYEGISNITGLQSATREAFNQRANMDEYD